MCLHVILGIRVCIESKFSACTTCIFSTFHMSLTVTTVNIKSIHIIFSQLFLQRLNYLSLSYKIDGVYSEVTLNAVRRFQTSHNKRRALLTLPENGLLTAACFQYLRQGFITIYASLIRSDLDTINFDFDV